jgi:hypothetical protein
VYTLEAVSKRQACGTATLRVSPRILELLIWVGDARYQGFGWNSYEGGLSMCASNANGGGYDASMMSGDIPGFHRDSCGIWAVSTISRSAGVTSSCVCGPCENMASFWAIFADTGAGGCVYSEHEPDPAIYSDGDYHANVGQQLVQW